MGLQALRFEGKGRSGSRRRFPEREVFLRRQHLLLLLSDTHLHGSSSNSFEAPATACMTACSSDLHAPLLRRVIRAAAFIRARSRCRQIDDYGSYLYCSFSLALQSALQSQNCRSLPSSRYILLFSSKKLTDPQKSVFDLKSVKKIRPKNKNLKGNLHLISLSS